jgi:hypothetical protein
LARLRASTISQNRGQGDPALTVTAFAEALAEYPADIAMEACRYWAHSEKVWPTLAELRARLEAKAQPRRLLAAAIERGRGWAKVGTAGE